MKTFVVHGKTIGTNDGSEDLPKVAVRLEEAQVLSLLPGKTVSDVNLDEDTRRILDLVLVYRDRREGNKRVISQDRLWDSSSLDCERSSSSDSWKGSTRL